MSSIFSENYVNDEVSRLSLSLSWPRIFNEKTLKRFFATKTSTGRMLFHYAGILTRSSLKVNSKQVYDEELQIRHKRNDKP